jgi:hypothetical protein
MAKEYGILFIPETIEAIEDDRKTMTRQICDRQPPAWEKMRAVGIDCPDCGKSFYFEGYKDEELYWWPDNHEPHDASPAHIAPKYQPGDWLYVKETFEVVHIDKSDPRNFVLHVKYTGSDEIFYKYECDYDYDFRKFKVKKYSKLHMPKFLARLWLEVESVKVERVQEISEEDAMAEGIEEIGQQKFHGNIWKNIFKSYDKNITCCSAVAAFETLWIKINGQESWDRNDWVFAYRFKRIKD